MFADADVIVVGAGLSGIVIAEQFASRMKKRVVIIDKRNHLGGNCYDYIDKDTGILMNKYGAHLFHTNDEGVYSYITQFCNWKRWEHKVVGLVNDTYVPIPVNITTVNTLCNTHISSDNEMKQWLNDNQESFDIIENSEQIAKSRVGTELYDCLFKHYTYKQWNKYPHQLAPEILARIPVRSNYDNRYFSDKYQLLPEFGYTYFFESILNRNPLIRVHLNTDFFSLSQSELQDKLIIYTGPIDAYFHKKGLPPLEYRSIDFEITKLYNTHWYQPNSVVNYNDRATPYTRCVEYKHFLNQKSKHTIIVKEKSTDKGEPYYPVLNDSNISLYEQYKKLAETECNVHFLGRLASYKYFNMDQAIRNSLDYFETHFL